MTNSYGKKISKSVVAIAALLTITMIVSVSEQSAFATSDTSKITSNGNLVPAKSTTTANNVRPLSTSKYTSFSWSECGHNYSGWFQPSLNTPATSQVKFAWSWPSSTVGGFACTTQSFDSIQNFLTDVAQGWTVQSALETSTSNSGKTYNIVDNNGNPMYVQSGDIMQAHENGCYGWLCTDGRNFYTSTWVAS